MTAEFDPELVAVAEIPTADWTWIDTAAVRFEQEWKQGTRPRIEDFLADVDESRRPLLLEELLRVERELLQRAGEEPDVDQYRRRFPDSAALIDAVFSPEPEPSGATGLRRPESNPATTGPITPASDQNGDQEPAPGSAVRYFGDYELIREIGRGGMGVVYKARQTSLNRLVALKMIRSAALASEDELRRFQNEAEAIALLDHPQIVPILEVGNHEGQRYFSMKLIGGLSLDKKLADYTADPRAAANLLKTAAEAVHHAHQRGILHRDLKPANILLDEHRAPYVSDFGLAKRVEGDSELTHSGAIIGTPAYMAPEQASGRRGSVTTASDVYGLGAILYALLTGRAPFGGDSIAETLEQLRSATPSSPSKLNPRVPRDLEVICLKCLEKEPARRYASAQALAEDLGRYLAGEAIVARSVTRFERVVKWARRKPAITALLGLVTLVSALGLGGVLWQWSAALLARRTAELNSERAMEQTELAEQRLYDVRMNLLQRYWENGDDELARQALAEQLPTNLGDVERQGFEWFYWERKLSSGLVTFKGHGLSSARVAAFSPDCKQFASSRSDGMMTIWDVVTGRETLTFKGHSSAVMCLAFSSDGSRIASASYDGSRLSTSYDRTVKIWDAGTGQQTLTLEGHPEWVTSVAFSPDGTRIAAGGQRTVTVWDARTGQNTLTLKGDTSVAFSPDDKWLVSAGSDNTVKVWDAGTGQATNALIGHKTRVKLVAFSRDGKRIISSDAGGTVKVWNARTGNQTGGHGHGSAVTCVAFSPDGKWTASASSDGTVQVSYTETGRQAVVLKGHKSEVMNVAFSPDGRRIASAGRDGVVRAWEWEAWTKPESLTLKGLRGYSIASVAFSSDGKQIVSADQGGTVQVWDAWTGQETDTIYVNAPGGAGSAVSFSLDGRRIVSTGRDRTVKVWDAGSRQQTLTIIENADVVDSVAFSPDGQRIATAGNNRAIKLWDARTGLEALTLKGHVAAVTSIAFSPDGQRIAAASHDHKVQVWDTRTGQRTLILKGHTDIVAGVAFSSDGKRIASASYDRTVKVWDAVSGQQTLTLKGHTEMVQSVAFSPDGRRIASASWDGTTQVWDAGTGQETLTLRGRSGAAVLSVVFSPDGRRIASGDADGTIKLWETTPWTADERATREAMRIVEGLFAQDLPVAEVITRIRRDTISHEVRDRALGLAESQGRTLAIRQAERLVKRLFDGPLIREEALESLRADATLSESVRSQALYVAQHYPLNGQRLNEESWEVVRWQSKEPAAYLKALRQAEAASGLDPNNGMYLNTLGVAQYRAGSYQAAVATLTRSDQINSQAFGSSDPADLAFLAMAQFRLGEIRKARALMGRLTEAMKNAKWAQDPSAQEFQRETESIARDATKAPNHGAQ